MNETVLTADGQSIAAIPRAEWEAELRGAPDAIKTRLAFMTPEHHAVRRYAVAELPRRGRAITTQEIAAALSSGAAAVDARRSTARVETIVNDLERALFFVVRTQGTAVSWAFPVTVDETPHAIAFSTGERCYAA